MLTSSLFVASLDDNQHAAKRAAMVEHQLVRRGVRDTLVLEAMGRVPRHYFVPPGAQTYAYDDYPLPIGDEQTISQPYIVAVMTEALGLIGGERILEIGTGSGYQTAILAEIAGHVYTVELLPNLAQEARQTLEALGYENISYRVGDGWEGWPEYAPYDGIMATAAPAEVPSALVEQLAAARHLVLPLGEVYQNLVRVTKEGSGRLSREVLTPVRFVPLRRQKKTGE